MPTNLPAMFQGSGKIFILCQNCGLIHVSFNLKKKTQLDCTGEKLSGFFSCLSQTGKDFSEFNVIILCLTRICTQLALLSPEYGESPHSTS